LPHTLVFHLIDLGKKLQKAGFHSSPKYLSYSEAVGILVIDSNRQISQAEIAAKLHLKPASVVTLIDELEKLKLVKRKMLPGNRRKHQISLTTYGKIQVRKIKKQTKSLENYLAQQLKAKNKDKFFSTVTKLIESLENWPQNNPNQLNRRGVRT